MPDEVRTYFYKLKLKNTQFNNCNLQDADFTEANLTNSSFRNCNFSNAIFENTILEKVDFRNSYNYSINLETNPIKNAKFSSGEIKGLLDKYGIEIE